MSSASIVIVGGGIAGSAAALRAAQYHLHTVWILGDADTERRSRAQWVVNIDNMIGIHEGVVKKKYLASLKDESFAAARKHLEGLEPQNIGTRDIIENTKERIGAEYSEYIEFVESKADRARLDGQKFVIGAGGKEYPADYLVLATGVMDRQPSIKREKGEQIIDDPKWIYPFANRESVLYCIRCEGHLTAGTCAAVIGPSEAAAQLAMMLKERYDSACSVLTNGETPSWSEASENILRLYQIAVHRERITDVRGKKGRLNTIALEGGTQVDVAYALVAAGLFRVYNELARELGATLTDPEEPIDVRHVEIDRHSETSVPNLFAVGDMTRRKDEGVMKQVYTSQEYAVRALDMIDRRIRQIKRAALVAQS
jgi:thioredoxin reductase (NADPH)